MNGVVFGKRVSADVINIRISGGGRPGSRRSLHPWQGQRMEVYFTHRRGHVLTGRDEVTGLQAKDCCQHPAAGGGGRHPPQDPPRHRPAHTSGQNSGLQDRDIRPCRFQPPSLGSCVWSAAGNAFRCPSGDTFCATWEAAAWERAGAGEASGGGRGRGAGGGAGGTPHLAAAQTLCASFGRAGKTNDLRTQ